MQTLGFLSKQRKSLLIVFVVSGPICKCFSRIEYIEDSKWSDDQSLYVQEKFFFFFLVMKNFIYLHPQKKKNM